MQAWTLTRSPGNFPPSSLAGDHAMNAGTFPIEFIGGSQDGEIVEGMAAPDFCDLTVADGVKEIYERQNDGPPFIYVQIGYTGSEAPK